MTIYNDNTEWLLDLEELIRTYKQRICILRRKSAKLGLSAGTEVIIEIEHDVQELKKTHIEWANTYRLVHSLDVKELWFDAGVRSILTAR